MSTPSYVHRQIKRCGKNRIILSAVILAALAYLYPSNLSSITGYVFLGAISWTLYFLMKALTDFRKPEKSSALRALVDRKIRRCGRSRIILSAVILAAVAILHPSNLSSKMVNLLFGASCLTLYFIMKVITDRKKPEDFSTLRVLADLIGETLKFFNTARDHEDSSAPTSFTIYDDGTEAAAEIDREMSGNVKHLLSTRHLTQSWFLDEGIFYFGAVRLKDLVWVYTRKCITKKKYSDSYYFIVMLNSKYGKAMPMGFSTPKEADFWTAEIKSRAPSIIVGYSAERLSLWKSQPEKFHGLARLAKDFAGAYVCEDQKTNRSMKIEIYEEPSVPPVVD